MSKLNRRVRAFRTVAAIGLLSLACSAMAAAADQPALIDLVRAGNHEAALAALGAPGVDVNARAADGSTALMWATFSQDKELVRALLKAGAKADVTSNYGDTALTEAIKLEDMDLFHALLDAGANVDSPNLEGQTALMLAISIGNQDMAKELVQRGANVKAIETFRDQTALMWAAGGNQPEIVDLLLARGAGSQVNLRAKFDDWARQMTSEPRAQFASRQTGGLTALLYATRSGCMRCAESLVQAGADVNKPNPDGVTPLINALDNRHFDMAMFLLDKGADPNTWDMSGRTPLYVAIDMNSFRGGGGGFGPPGGGGAVNPGGIGGVVGGPGAGPAAAEAPAAGAAGAPAGAAAGGRGGRGGPAGGGGRGGGPGGFGGGPGGPAGARAPAVSALDVARRLLDMGVDTDHQLTRKRPYGNGRGRFTDYDMRGGAGPLFIATLANDQESMELLLKHGAEVDLENVFQMTPLMIAAGMRGTGRGGGGGDPARTIKSIDLLLDAGANINAKVTDSHTHTAVIMAYVAGRDQEGRTALMAAAESGQDRLVQHLLERGADPMIRDATGKTALDIARAPPPAGGPGGGGGGGGAAGAGAAPAGAAAGARAAPAAGAGAGRGPAAGGGGPPGGRGGPPGGGRAAVVSMLEAAMAKAGGAAAPASR